VALCATIPSDLGYQHPISLLLINITLCLFGLILNKIIFVLITEERVPLHGWG
jgi:hypothetical protein